MTMAVPASEQRALIRAVHELEVERLAGGDYRVTGGANVHIVDRETGACDCFDYRLRRVACAHIMRVRLAIGDATVIRELRAVVPKPKRPRKAGA